MSQKQRPKKEEGRETEEKKLTKNYETKKEGKDGKGKIIEENKKARAALTIVTLSMT
jgi:hypothetical protein